MKTFLLKSIRTFLFPAYLSVFLLACSDSDEKIEALERQVLDIHDRLMPKMDEVMSLKADLNKLMSKQDSLEQSGVSGNDMAQERVKTRTLEKELVTSDSLMMNWMNEYKGDSIKNLASTIAESYFAKEKEKIQAIEAQTIKAIQDARTFLQK